MTIIVNGEAGFISSNCIFHMMPVYLDYLIVGLDKLTRARKLSTLKDIMDNPTSGS